MAPQLSLPSAFEENMRRLLGNDFDEFRAALREPAPVSIRLNPTKKNNVSATKTVPWCNTGVYLPERPVFTVDPYFHGGSYYVQEASSMFLEQALRQTTDLSDSLVVLDLCAAPGGKSTHLLSLLGTDSLLISNEVIRSRVPVLAENITKWGRSNVVVTSNDPNNFSSLANLFDVVVVDAPCSGEGLFRKDAQATSEWSPESVSICARRQRRILTDIWPSIREGGILIYSTCTYNREENEDNIGWLLKEFDAEFCRLQLQSGWNISRGSGENDLGYRFYPHRVDGEGFFLSAVKKKSLADKHRPRTPDRSIFADPAREVVKVLQDWMTDDNHAFLQWHDVVQVFPSDHVQLLDRLSEKLRVIQAGTVAATVKGKKVIPAHGLSLSLTLNPSRVDQVALRLEEALLYLRGESLSLNSSEKGYAIVTFDGLPLGWVNRLSNRLNNLYPQRSRIRMQI